MKINDLKNNFTNTKRFDDVFELSNSYSKNFQRLEFLGDRVLGLSIADILFNKFTSYNEGKLAKLYAYLTSAKVITKIAKHIGLVSYLNDKGFENISDRVLSDFLEAIIGSLFLDSGFLNSKNIISKLWEEEIGNNIDLQNDFKSALQEWTQSKKLGLPAYKLIKKLGPDHDPVFYVSLIIKDKGNICGLGKSIQIAEQDAAEKFLLQNKIL